MMHPDERKTALREMRRASSAFYAQAVRIGNHPFIEFTGLMNEYIKACEAAHEQGIDFTECNTHSGQPLPIESYMRAYINEKLECIFVGQSVMTDDETKHATAEAADAARDIMAVAVPAIADAAIVGRTYGWPQVIDTVTRLAKEHRATKQALTELVQSADYVMRNHGHQITGTLKLAEDLKRAETILGS